MSAIAEDRANVTLDPITKDREQQLVRRGVLSSAECGVRSADTAAVVCAWCDQEEGIVRTLASGASHGICPRHLQLWENGLATETPSAQSEFSTAGGGR